jgi:hypothetical protein
MTRRHVRVYLPNHPRATASGEVYAHVVIAEAALGKSLPAGAEVHHVDGDPRNNAPRNLVICENRAYHRLLHARARIVRMGGKPDGERVCAICYHVLAREKFNRLQTACRECMRRYNAAYIRRWSA